MWQTDWASKTTRIDDAGNRRTSTLSREYIISTYCLLWSEHCLECAVPECYRLCPLYVARGDGKCARFKNGILANPHYPGFFDYGAEIQFRRWGKLESNLGFGFVTSSQARAFDRVNRAVLRTIQSLPFKNLQTRAKKSYALLRERFLQSMRFRRKENFDEFVIEVWNLQDSPVRLAIECWQQGLKFRSSIVLEPGRTAYAIPTSALNINLYGPHGMIRLFPENDLEAHLVFSWLDFVKYRISAEPHGLPTAMHTRKPGVPSAKKVKCVIWDLDNTAWDGVVTEQNPEQVSLRPEVLKTMLALDERGILQSVASKNDFENAWPVLERLGVSHLLLHPQINWHPKSVNIRSIVDSLNIGVDSCVFIDDSAFERAEVAEQVPDIRVFSDSDIQGLLDRPDFDVPVTAESKQRRGFYIADSQRKKQALDYGDRYEAFLITCRMEARLFSPSDAEQVERCLELLHRSNQLNLSTHRYSREELEALLEENDVVSICTACRDRFGEYGIVGFASLQLSENRVVLKDFVLSCRVLQKKVENAWFKWLGRVASAAGYQNIFANYVKTPRNGLLLNALTEVGFVETEKTETGSMLELNCEHTPSASDIVSVIADSFELQFTSVSR